jgi:hypothetical protein
MLAYADVCGIHIMQTHVASTLSEEIQMKGRTARQGEKGSWAMVLRKKELSQTYAITDEELSLAMSAAASDAARKAVWALIDGKRMGINVKQLQELIAFVASNERTHADALAFVAALLKRDKEAVRLYLERRNKPQRSGSMAGKARILVLMDATGSMGNVLSAAKDAVGEMFSRAGIKYLLVQKYKYWRICVCCANVQTLTHLTELRKHHRRAPRQGIRQVRDAGYSLYLLYLLY